MTLSDSLEQPIVVQISGKEIVFPKLKLRSFGLLAARYQASQLAKLKKFTEGEKASAEAKLRLLTINAASEYGIEDVHNWSTSIDGSIAVAKESLVTGGTEQGAAELLLQDLSPVELRGLAMELVDHPQSPRRMAFAQAEWEAKTKTEEEAKNPPKSAE